LSQRLLGRLVAFAVGVLLGDVFIHVFPIVFAAIDDPEHHHHGHRHTHGHAHGSQGVFKGVLVLSGVIGFLCVDKLIRSLSGGHHHHHDDHGDHSGSHEATESKGKSTATEESALRKRHASKQAAKAPAEAQHNHGHHDHADGNSSGYLTFLAGAVHSFTDGLTLAIAFHTSASAGLSTLLAVALHEIPHKLGDFAIMLRSGLSRRKAFGLQFLLAGIMLFGTAAGSWLRTQGGFDIVVPVAAGGLVYTALVGLLPDVLAAKGRDFVLQVVALISGVSLMAFMALNE
jgi:zinc transporter 7